MIKPDLIKVVNSGKAWIFVGSGVSCDSGCPSWRGLLDAVVNDQSGIASKKIQENAIYRRHYNRLEYQNCFSIVEKEIGKEKLDGDVSRLLDRYTVPSNLVKSIVDWPVRGYITTNYDNLLEIALSKTGQSGWLSVGNSKDEIIKVTGDAEKLVWHIHGAKDLSGEKSRLILSEEDYDMIYGEESEAIQQLQAILRTNRVIFIGFGFNDLETIRLLRRCGKSLSPNRPLYAFIGGLDGGAHKDEREEYLYKYNVDVIPYKIVDNDHGRLRDLVSMYSSFMARRSIKYGQSYHCPSYNESTTSLMIYNKLVMGQPNVVTRDVYDLMLKSLILSIAKHRGGVTHDDLEYEIFRSFEFVKRSQATLAERKQLISKTISQLVDDKLLTTYSDKYVVTEDGDVFVSNSKATAEVLNEQFMSCLKARATGLVETESSINSVAEAAYSFFNDCVDKRALGVAMVDSAYTEDIQNYHIVGLMQNLPDVMGYLNSSEEAVALSSLVQSVLSSPDKIEKRYISIATQARFGIHLLGLDSAAIKERLDEIKNTIFLIDSSSLIPLLARSSVGYAYTKQLVDNLRRCQSTCLTTDYFVEETAEHAHYALKRIDQTSGQATHATLATCLGVGGERSNAFLEGFVYEVYEGGATSFKSYLKSACGGTGEICKNTDICDELSKHQILCREFSEFDGFSDELLPERDDIQNVIASKRKRFNSYTHPRQTKAEAEALLIVKNIRSGVFSIDGFTNPNSYFVSYTRVIDEVDGGRRPITMRPESLYHWLLTVLPVDDSEIEVIFNGLVWELSERDMAIVDSSVLRTAFSPYVYASQEKLNEELEEHRGQLSEIYGEDYKSAFSDSATIYTPIVYESVTAQRAQLLEDKLELERKKRLAAETDLKSQDNELKDLKKFKKKRADKKVKHKRKQNAAKSKPKKKRRKK